MIRDNLVPVTQIALADEGVIESVREIAGRLLCYESASAPGLALAGRRTRIPFQGGSRYECA